MRKKFLVKVAIIATLISTVSLAEEKEFYGLTIIEDLFFAMELRCDPKTGKGHMIEILEDGTEKVRYVDCSVEE